MTTDQMTDLVRRANAAGHDTVPDYCLRLVEALTVIGEANSGVWGMIARNALYGREGER